MLSALNITAQVGINTIEPHPASTLDVNGQIRGRAFDYMPDAEKVAVIDSDGFIGYKNASSFEQAGINFIYNKIKPFYNLTIESNTSGSFESNGNILDISQQVQVAAGETVSFTVSAVVPIRVTSSQEDVDATAYLKTYFNGIELEDKISVRTIKSGEAPLTTLESTVLVRYKNNSATTYNITISFLLDLKQHRAGLGGAIYQADMQRSSELNGIRVN